MTVNLTPLIMLSESETEREIWLTQKKANEITRVVRAFRRIADREVWVCINDQYADIHIQFTPSMLDREESEIKKPLITARFRMNVPVCHPKAIPGYANTSQLVAEPKVETYKIDGGQWIKASNGIKLWKKHDFSIGRNKFSKNIEFAVNGYGYDTTIIQRDCGGVIDDWIQPLLENPEPYMGRVMASEAGWTQGRDYHKLGKSLQMCSHASSSWLEPQKNAILACMTEHCEESLEVPIPKVNCVDTDKTFGTNNVSNETLLFAPKILEVMSAFTKMLKKTDFIRTDFKKTRGGGRQFGMIIGNKDTHKMLTINFSKEWKQL